MCYNSLFSWYHHGLIITSVLQSSCVVWYNCEWNHTGSGNAVNCLLIGIIKADVDWLGRYPFLGENLRASKGGVCTASKEIRTKRPHLHTVGMETETCPRSFLHALCRKASSPRGIVTSSARMTNIALPSSLEFKVIGFQLPPRQLQLEYYKGVGNLSLNLYLSLTLLSPFMDSLFRETGSPTSSSSMLVTSSSSCTSSLDHVLRFCLLNLLQSTPSPCLLALVLFQAVASFAWTTAATSKSVFLS